MNSSPPERPNRRPANAARIVLAFAGVYFFWGSTYTAIRIGAAEMPALLLAGTRFLIAGTLLLAWCRWRGLRLFWPPRTMLLLGLMGLLLLGGGNVGLVYAEQTLPSGLASLVLAVIPLYVALIEIVLPGGEPLPVLNLARLVNASPGANPSYPVTIVVRVGPADGREMLGLAADAALEVVHVPPDSIVAGEGGFLQGEAPLGGEVVRILNLEALGS